MFTGVYSDNVGGVNRRIDEAESVGQKSPHQAITRASHQKAESSNLTSGMSARGLAKRLGITHPVVGKMKSRGADVFSVWSKELDPDGLSWQLRGDKYYFLPKESESSD